MIAATVTLAFAYRLDMAGAVPNATGSGLPYIADKLALTSYRTVLERCVVREERLPRMMPLAESLDFSCACRA